MMLEISAPSSFGFGFNGFNGSNLHKLGHDFVMSSELLAIK